MKPTPWSSQDPPASPVCPVNDTLSISAFVIFGNQEPTVACGPMAILAESDTQKRDDIIRFEKRPCFILTEVMERRQ